MNQVRSGLDGLYQAVVLMRNHEQDRHAASGPYYVHSRPVFHGGHQVTMVPWNAHAKPHIAPPCSMLPPGTLVAGPPPASHSPPGYAMHPSTPIVYAAVPGHAVSPHHPRAYGEVQGGATAGKHSIRHAQKTPSVHVETIIAALSRTLDANEWDERLDSIGTRDINIALKKSHFTKEEIAQIKSSRRRAKNRTYAKKYRDLKKGGTKQDAPAYVQPHNMAATIRVVPH
eukprot:m.159964 g.159964  ORF g.159964 m.159964 type:complete len:228 (-) comp11884_c0_seq1:238-921(-)